MSYIIRKVHKPWWYKDRQDEFRWLEKGELLADILSVEMATEKGTLSTYSIDCVTQLNRVVAALACSRDSLQNLDYVLFPKSALDNCFEFCGSHTRRYT